MGIYPETPPPDIAMVGYINIILLAAYVIISIHNQNRRENKTLAEKCFNLSYMLKNNHRTEKQKQSYKHAGKDCSSKAISA